MIDAVGMEAHGNPFAAFTQKLASRMPDRIGRPMAEEFGVDRLRALTDSIASVRRGGTVSVSGVYMGAVDPLPMMEMFDKGIQLRMGQCHVRRWVEDLLPLLRDGDDPFGTGDLASHYLPLADAAQAYEVFQHKRDGCTKVILEPGRTEPVIYPGGAGALAGLPG